MLLNSRNYYSIMSVLRQDYVMNCLGFPNNYFDKAVVTVQGSFTGDIRNTYIKNSLEDCFSNLNLIYIRKNEKEIRKDC